ncbi:MAG: hypothetical protein R2771_05470 [Saprospiraceae bacterium]
MTTSFSEGHCGATTKQGAFSSFHQVAKVKLTPPFELNIIVIASFTGSTPKENHEWIFNVLAIIKNSNL